MLSRVLRVLMGASIAGALVVSASAQASAAVSTTRKSVTIVGVGSDNTYEAMNDIDQLYNESPGCAIIPVAGGTFTNYQQTCLNPGTLAYSTDYADLISTENLYHDRAVEAYPVGSTNGRLVLTQYVTNNNTAIQADYARSSSKQTYVSVSGFTPYGVAWGRGGVGYWVGSNNHSVFNTAAGVPNPNLTIAQMKLIWVGNAGGQCGINFAASSTSSLGAALGPAGSGTIDEFATQAGSGTGLDFLRKIDPAGTYSNATALQNCIPAQFKDGTGGDDHVIFENNAGPICGLGLRASAIYPYEFARFVQNKGGTVACAGVMGRVEKIKPSAASIAKLPGTTGAFPMGGYRYVYFEVPSAVDVNDPTTWTGQIRAVLEMWHPVYGWVCKTTAHATDPISGSNYRTRITDTIKADGFAPLPSATLTGGTFTGTSFCRDAATT